MDEQMVGLGDLAEKWVTISVLINNYFVGFLLFLQMEIRKTGDMTSPLIHSFHSMPLFFTFKQL